MNCSRVRILTAWFSLAVAFLLLFSVPAASAGTDQIRVMTESGGEVTSLSNASLSNTHGALVWGSDANGWMLSNNSAHMYFVNSTTGLRLANHTTVADLSGTGAGFLYSGKSIWINASLYSYQVRSPNGSGLLTITGNEYRVDIRLADGISDHQNWQLVLRSRATGLESSPAFFTAFLAPVGGNQVLVVDQGGSVYLSARSLSALLREGTTPSEARYIFNSTGADYWLDISGGSDMGGVTVRFNQSLLTSSISSTPEQFKALSIAAVMVLDNLSIPIVNLVANMTPGIASVVYTPDTGPAAATDYTMLLVIVVIVLLLALALLVFRKKKR